MCRKICTAPNIYGLHLISGAIVLTYGAHGGDNQKWYKDGDFIVSKMNGKVLSIMTTTDQVAIWDRDDGKNGQRWVFERLGEKLYYPCF